ncbi:Thioredoxin-like protein CITRX, chloroplastic [Linum perenne]
MTPILHAHSPSYLCTSAFFSSNSSQSSLPTTGTSSSSSSSSSLNFPLHKSSLLSSPRTKFSLSSQPRRLLCAPPHGKYIRDDYLVKKKTAQEIEELVRGERTLPIVIDFYATWCGPCILMAQEIEMVSSSTLNLIHHNTPFRRIYLYVLMGNMNSLRPEGFTKPLAVEYENKALIIKVETDDEYEFARDMQVRGLPTLLFISPDPNKDAIRAEGLIPIQMMRDILDNDM